MEIYDQHRRYGEGYNAPHFKPSGDTLRLIMSGLLAASLCLEALEVVEYFIDDPELVLGTLVVTLLHQGKPVVEQFLLRLAKIQFKAGNVQAAEATLGFLDEMETHCMNMEEKCDVLRMRYQSEGPDKMPSIRRLLQLSEIFTAQGDLDASMEAIESAAEVHCQLGVKPEIAEVGHDIHDRLQKLCDQSGDLLSSIQFEFRRCDMTSSITKDLAAARSRRSELLALPMCSTLAFFQRLHHRQCLEYLLVHQRASALEHAEKYVSYCQKYKDEGYMSAAENLRIKALIEPARMSDEVREVLLAEVSEGLESGMTRDKAAGRLVTYAEKALLLAGVLEELGDLQGEDREDSWPAIEKVLSDAEETFSVSRSKPEGMLLLLEISYLKGMFSRPSHQSAEPVQSLAAEAADGGRAGPGSEASQHQTVHDGYSRRSFNAVEFVSGVYHALQSESAMAFSNLLKGVNAEAERLQHGGHPLEKAQFLLHRGLLYYILVHYMDLGLFEVSEAGFRTRRDGLSKSLKCFVEALDIGQQFQHQIQEGPEKLAGLVSLQAFYANEQLFETALSICFEIDDNDLTWKWVQRSKARAYSAWLRKCFAQDSESGMTLAGFQPLVSFEDMLWVSSATKRTVVFADWVAVHHHLDQPRMFLVMLKFGRDVDGPIRKITGVQLDVDMEDIDDKIRRLTTARLDSTDSQSILAGFVPLLQPLVEFSSEGDILILSPTAPLHNVPLHAVDLMGTPLLERNPVAYVPSLSVLVSCLKRLEAPQSGAGRPPEWKAAVTGAYDDWSCSDVVTGERNKIYDSLRTLGHNLSSTPVLGLKLDVESFSRTAQEANLVHFHGHGLYNEHDILRQSLVLGPRDSYLHLQQILSLGLAAPHINLIACEGGIQDFSIGGDEPLGLLSAFLAGGAASAIGALWPVQSATGRRFTELFFEHFLHHLDRRELGPVVNLAEALRHACKIIRSCKETSTPYHWAPFILYGAWFCGRKPGETW